MLSSILKDLLNIYKGKSYKNYQKIQIKGIFKALSHLLREQTFMTQFKMLSWFEHYCQLPSKQLFC